MERWALNVVQQTNEMMNLRLQFLIKTWQFSRNFSSNDKKIKCLNNLQLTFWLLVHGFAKGWQGKMLNSLQVLIVLIASLSVSCDEYEDNIEFILHNGHETHVSTFDTLLSEQGCDLNGNFSLVTHGWVGSNSGWIPDLISNLSFYRQGCVIFMNYSYYGDRKNYFEAISFFEPVSRLLTKKLFQITDEGICHDHIFMFGFSLGGRIVIEAALNYGENLISAIDSKLSWF